MEGKIMNNYGLALIDEIFNDFFKNDDLLVGPRTNIMTRKRIAMSKWDDKEENLLVFIEAPGFKKEDIKIEATGNVIEISGKISDEHLSEIFSNEFSYNLKDSELDVEKVKAKLEDGILKVIIPKKTEKKIKKKMIAIE